jgi:hypothetical protein
MTAQLDLFPAPVPTGAGQRWRDQSTSWAAPDADRFRPGRYAVAPVADAVACRFVLRHHYAGSYPSALLRYGLIDKASSELVGVSVLSYPVQPLLLTNAFPTLEPCVQSMELGRFVLLDEVPHNAESWFLARVFDQAADHGVLGVVSCSDPYERTTLDGMAVFLGHAGTIYQASNGRYLGQAEARKIRLLPDGRVLHDRALTKIRHRQRGWRGAAARLTAWGAPPLRDGQDPHEWLDVAMQAAQVRRVRHGGVHRYAFRTGDRAQRRRTPLGLPEQPYPKQDAA